MNTMLRFSTATPDLMLAERVRTTLGLPDHAHLSFGPGETATRVAVWSITELLPRFERFGGTVSARAYEEQWGGTVHHLMEVTVTVDLPGVGEVEVFTTWEPATELEGWALFAPQLTAA